MTSLYVYDIVSYLTRKNQFTFFCANNNFIHQLRLGSPISENAGPWQPYLLSFPSSPLIPLAPTELMRFLRKKLSSIHTHAQVTSANNFCASRVLNLSKKKNERKSAARNEESSQLDAGTLDNGNARKGLAASAGCAPSPSTSLTSPALQLEKEGNFRHFYGAIHRQPA